MGMLEERGPIRIPSRKQEDNVYVYVFEGIRKMLRIGHKSGEGEILSSCERGNELSGFIKSRKFFDKLRNCYVLENDSATCM